MIGEPKTLAEVHRDGVYLVELIKGIDELARFALRDVDAPISEAIEHALEAARAAGQSIVNEIEYASGISTRPGQKDAAIVEATA